MIELLILWNVASLRTELSDEDDIQFGLIGFWVMLQVLIWPISLFVIMCRWFHWNIFVSLIAASAFTIAGYLLWAESFYFLTGFTFVGLAGAFVARAIMKSQK